MPFNWNSENERTILLLAMGKTVSFDKASPFCAEVATFLGGGVTANAVRYCLQRFLLPVFMFMRMRTIFLLAVPLLLSCVDSPGLLRLQTSIKGGKYLTSS